MRPLRSLFIFLAAVFVGGALLAPWLYWLAQSAGQHAQWLEELARSPFHRFVTRSFLLLALLGLWPLLGALNARSWCAIGLVKPAGKWRGLGRSFALGFGSLACVAILSVLFGGRLLDNNIADKWLTRIPAIAATAAVVSILEECLFRGILFGALYRARGFRIAIACSSLFYAAAHFFQRVKPPAEITWSSGLELLPQMAVGFADARLMLPGFIALTLTGATLALAFQRTGNLWFSIGLHAGWIFWLKSYSAVTDGARGAATWIWGTNKLYDGWLAFLVLAIVAVIVWKLPQTPPPHDNGR